jgi:nucleotide-binding universal stress UspA family protein
MAVDPSVGRRLPFNLACRYRALPVAAESGHITVAMENPHDAEARRAIRAALGPSACLVRTDPLIIDALLAELWPDETCDSLQIAICAPAGPAVADLDEYGRAIAALLKARVISIDIASLRGGWELPACDLAILPPLAAGMAGKWAHGPVRRSGGEQGPRSALFAGRQSWPLRHVWLVVSEDPLSTGEAPLAWTVRLARPSRAAVTVLAVAPPTRRTRQKVGLDAWLAGDAAAGHRLWRAAGRLVDAGLEARLRLRQGPRRQEISRELAGEAIDLAVLGGAWADDDLEALLQQAPCPLLIAGGPAAASRADPHS